MAIKTQVIEYKEGDTVCEGFLAYDDSKGKRPGVLVMPDWRSVTAFDHKRCTMLAELGYTAFAADPYGKGVRPTSYPDCTAEMMKYGKDRPKLRARAMAGLNELKKQAATDTSKLAAMGYCFGGLASLELARSGAEVKGVVSFHGNLNTPNPADAKNIRGAVLVLHGNDDPVVPPAEVEGFYKEMRDAKVDYQLVAYANAVHSFTNWDIPEGTPGPASYNKKADSRSWVAMQDFFREVFG